MRISTVIIMAAFVLTLVITGVSFFVIGQSRGNDQDSSVDKAQLIYGRGLEYIKAQEVDKAVYAYIKVTEEYPASEYSEKALRDLGAIFMQTGGKDKAKYYYSRLLKDFPEAEDASQTKSILEKINREMMQSPSMTRGSVEYIVRPGDTLSKIAKKHNTTVNLIKNMNGLNSDIIRIGQKLMVNTSTFSIYVDKSDNILTLKKDGEEFKTYSVATGKNNSTPVGDFIIVDKVVRAQWTKPGVGIVMPDDEEYELGERWMAISAQGYGIHGTNDDASIGSQATAGCVRMVNADVIELYDIVPNGTKVEIVN